jgi:chromosome segregation ATPase
MARVALLEEGVVQSDAEIQHWREQCIMAQQQATTEAMLAKRDAQAIVDSRVEAGKNERSLQLRIASLEETLAHEGIRCRDRVHTTVMGCQELVEHYRTRMNSLETEFKGKVEARMQSVAMGLERSEGQLTSIGVACLSTRDEKSRLEKVVEERETQLSTCVDERRLVQGQLGDALLECERLSSSLRETQASNKDLINQISTSQSVHHAVSRERSRIGLEPMGMGSKGGMGGIRYTRDKLSLLRSRLYYSQV